MHWRTLKPEQDEFVRAASVSCGYASAAPERADVGQGFLHGLALAEHEVDSRRVNGGWPLLAEVSEQMVVVPDPSVVYDDPPVTDDRVVVDVVVRGPLGCSPSVQQSES
jgi:hypothetical protein